MHASTWITLHAWIAGDREQRRGAVGEGAISWSRRLKNISGGDDGERRYGAVGGLPGSALSPANTEVHDGKAGELPRPYHGGQSRSNQTGQQQARRPEDEAHQHQIRNRPQHYSRGQGPY